MKYTFCSGSPWIMSALKNQIWKILGKKGKEIPALPVVSCKISNPAPSVWHSIRFLVFSSEIHLTWCQQLLTSCSTFGKGILFQVSVCFYNGFQFVDHTYIRHCINITWYPMKYDVRCYISHIIFTECSLLTIK